MYFLFYKIFQTNFFSEVILQAPVRGYLNILEKHYYTRIIICFFKGSRGNQWQQCGTYTVLNNLYQTLTHSKREPIHILLHGEDLIKREILNSNEINGKILRFNNSSIETYSFDAVCWGSSQPQLSSASIWGYFLNSWNKPNKT